MRPTIRPLFLGLVALGITALPSIAAAQACFGNASFSVNHLQVTGDLTLNNDFEELGASIVSGSNSVFAGIGVASASYGGGDGNVGVRGTLGYQVPVSREGSVQICPVFRVGLGLRDENYNGLGGDFRTQSYGIGLGIGGALVSAQRFKLVPSLQVGVQRDVLKYSGILESDSIEDTYAYGGVALGFVINDALSFRPSVLIPGNARFDEPIFGVGLALNFGGRR